MERTYIYCSDLRDYGTCCESCHDEWSEGYGEPFVCASIPGILTSTCCGFPEASLPESRSAWASVLLAKRARLSADG